MSSTQDQIASVSEQTTTVIGELKPHPDFFFDDLYVAIEETLFKVSKRDFENNSEVFKTMYSIPVPEGSNADGSCRQNPLKLSGATADEFTQLLKVMYPSHHGKASVLSAPQWQSVLKLANLWDFQVTRRTAITHLQPVVAEMTPQEALVMARRHDVDKWLVDAVEVMAKRAEPMGMDDVNVIGVEDALRVANVREQAMNILKSSSIVSGWVDWKERSALKFRPTIKAVFGIGGNGSSTSPSNVAE
ncbi:hypothetical protein EIP91_010508 [Steccherinum ochraceum]|uniref:BTB domain-containing protein n=1 Tax=Steccherinum ochraceum TaxID=92696 RepID=A0A4R0RCP9_9APHY|nr:hypothetical protein EIP91_010508 [Steccherinum ochraceum]